MTLIGLIIVANVSSIKLVRIGPLVTTSSIVVFSLTFLVTDILNEIWGEAEAKRAVNSALICLIVCFASLGLVLLWPPAPEGGSLSVAFDSVMGISPRIMASSLINYAIVQSLNVFLFSRIRKATNGKLLWFRNGVATMLSQLTDSIVFSLLAFTGVFPMFQIIEIVKGALLIKLIVAILDTPVLYLACWAVRRFGTPEIKALATRPAQ